MRYLIAHCGWLPDRLRSLLRLEAQLDGDRVEVFESLGREHASIWARRIYESAAEGGDHVCILNDDVILHESFREICEAIVTAVPDEPISLHNSLPGSVDVGKWGFPWARAYRYTGPAVILPPGAARSLLDYTYALPWSYISRTNEDNIAGLWAWDRQRPFWCAIPAPVTHDVGIPSSLGYDDHPNRVPTVPWENFPDARLTDPNYWRCPDGTPPPLVQNPWAPTSLLAYMRRVFRAGRQICAVCTVKEAEVGSKDIGFCCGCVGELYAASVRGNQP